LFRWHFDHQNVITNEEQLKTNKAAMQQMLVQGGHKLGEKNSPSFPGFSRAINLLFHSLSQQKVTWQLATANSA